MWLEQNLVHYAAVAKGTVIVAEQVNENADLPNVAAKCLENLPPLHNRFSYTTRTRMFICLIDSLFIYCAIMDEALAKAEAFLFLEKLRDAFTSLLNEQGVDVETLGPHSLDNELGPEIRLLASPLVGIPQKERDREKEGVEEELIQVQRPVDVDLEVSSPSAVAPVDAMSDQEFALKTEEKPSGLRSPAIPVIGKGKKGHKKRNEHAKKKVTDNRRKAWVERNLEIMVDNSNPVSADSQLQQEQQHARRTWWRNVKVVLFLDVLVCLLFVAIWLVVCGGINCLK